MGTSPLRRTLRASLTAALAGLLLAGAPGALAAGAKPAVSTGRAHSVSAAAATLSGTVNPRGQRTSYRFQYGSSPRHLQLSGWRTLASRAHHSLALAVTVRGLRANTSYQFRLIARNRAGTSYGAVEHLRTPSGAHASGGPVSAYDRGVLALSPVGFWDLNGSGADRSGHGHNASYHGGSPALVSLPDGEQASDFNHNRSASGQYVSVPSSAQFSIPTTGQLTWEGWIRPDVLQFAHTADSTNYVDWMGKCQDYSPSCEWEARMYSASTPEGRPDRLSAYAFNPSAELGSGADWQPANGLLSAGDWLFVVGEYQTQNDNGSDCASDGDGPQLGTLNIWVDGIEWAQSDHGDTGCMNQYGVTPRAGSSPLDIGTMAFDSWFQGAIGKVAIFDKLLSQAQIAGQFQAMSGTAPAGGCAETCTLNTP